MKKSIKRFLVITQVLGLSALAATACTDNDKPVSKTADVSKDSTKNDSKVESKNSETTGSGSTGSGSTGSGSTGESTHSSK